MPERLSPEEYRSVYERVPRACVDLLIVTDGEGVLLTRRSIPPYNKMWHLPGGRILMQESLKDAIGRIAKKETGTSPRIEGLVGALEFLHDSDDGKFHSISLVYLLKLGFGSLVSLDFQSTEWGYFSEIPEDTHPIHGEFLNQPHILQLFR
jgi:8-oxo-dGTP diphosphatase